MADGFEIEGLAELIQTINQLERLPQTAVTKAARTGGKMVLQEAKKNAPVYDGWLKASMKLFRERRTNPGRAVFDVTFDRAYNSKLVKYSLEDKRSYYPASQEYGYVLRNGIKLEGLHFLRKAADARANEIEREMIRSIDAYIRDMERSNGRSRGTYRRASSGYRNLNTGRW